MEASSEINSILIGHFSNLDPLFYIIFGAISGLLGTIFSLIGIVLLKFEKSIRADIHTETLPKASNASEIVGKIFLVIGVLMLVSFGFMIYFGFFM